MNYYQVDGSTILLGPMKLPPFWADSQGIQYPLAEMARKGHAADLAALGWLPQNIITTAHDTETQEVSGYTAVVNGGQVDATETVQNRPLADVQALRILQVQQEGVARVAADFPVITDFNVLAITGALYSSIKTDSLNLTPALQGLLNNYAVCMAALATVGGYTDWNDVANYDAVNDPAWV